MLNLDKKHIEVLGSRFRLTSPTPGNESDEYEPDEDKHTGNVPDEDKHTGNVPENKKRPPVWIIVALVCAVLAIGLLLLLLLNKSGKEAEVVYETVNVAGDIDPVDIPAKKAATVAMITDSVNDIPLAIYPLEGLWPDITLSLPDTADYKICVATFAADCRGDNGDILGDFIIDGEKIARGSRRQGWCHISPEGEMTLGMGPADQQMNNALENGGCFFRQLPLVMNSTLCENTLKGKAHRRALGFREGKPAMARTLDRESLHDFSQALLDMGFTHAIYLPGGNGRWICRTDTGTQFINTIYPEEYKANFIVFRSE